MSRSGIRTPELTRKLTILEAAEYLGCTTRTIRNMIARGDLPAYRYGTRSIRINLADLDALGRRIPSAGGDAA